MLRKQEQLHFGIIENPSLGKHRFQDDQFPLHFSLLKLTSLDDQLAELEDLFTKSNRIN